VTCGNHTSRLFAFTIGVNPRTLERWEQGPILFVPLTLYLFPSLVIDRFALRSRVQLSRWLIPSAIRTHSLNMQVGRS
jgi:hypothetical protein